MFHIVLLFGCQPFPRLWCHFQNFMIKQGLLLRKLTDLHLNACLIWNLSIFFLVLLSSFYSCTAIFLLLYVIIYLLFRINRLIISALPAISRFFILHQWGLISTLWQLATGFGRCSLCLHEAATRLVRSKIMLEIF